MCEWRKYIFKMRDPLTGRETEVWVEYTGRGFEGWEITLPEHGFTVPVPKNFLKNFLRRKKLQFFYEKIKVNGVPIGKIIWEEIKCFEE